MIAQSFHYRSGAGIANREAFPGAAVEKRFAGGGAVQRHVADEDVFFRGERGCGRIDDEAPAGKAFAHVVVGVAFQFQGHALGQEGPEALAGRAVELEPNRVVGQGPRNRNAGQFRRSAWRRRFDARCGWAA